MLSLRSIPTGGGSLGIFLIVIDLVILFFATVALGLRLWSRRLKRVSLCFNDYAILLAWPFATGLIVTAIIAVISYDVGKHEQTIPLLELFELMPSVLQLVIAANLLWVSANTLVKLSILHLYLRVFSLPLTHFPKFVYIVSAIVVAFFVGVVLEQFLICRPFAKNWDLSLPGTCGDTTRDVLAYSIFDVCIDVMIFALPMPVLWRLQMPTRRKLGICIVFGLGGIICVITIVRAIAASNFTQLELDFTYQVGVLGLYGVLEPALAIINACMPVILPALREIVRFVRGKPSSCRELSSGAQPFRTGHISKESHGRRFDDSVPLTEVGMDSRIRPGSSPEYLEEIEPISYPAAAKVEPPIQVTWDCEMSYSNRHDAAVTSSRV